MKLQDRFSPVATCYRSVCLAIATGCILLIFLWIGENVIVDNSTQETLA